jgi:hypothetical protein
MSSVNTSDLTDYEVVVEEDEEVKRELNTEIKVNDTKNLE